MEKNYFFIDGSALMAQIRELQKKKRIFKDSRLDPLEFISYFQENLDELGSQSYKRAVFYIPNGDTQIKTYLRMPSFKKPGSFKDVNFKNCGKKIESSAAYERFLETVPKKFLNRCHRSEKGIDVEMCCDALKLASNNQLERLFLFTNDDDFLPLCKTLKDFGVNISLIHLSDTISPNESLVKECDSYDTILEEDLKKIFNLKIESTNPTVTSKTEPII